MSAGRALANIDEKVDGFVAVARRGYNRYSEKIIPPLFAVAVFASAFFLLETIPFFPSNWVIFISSVAALFSLRSKSASFALLWFALSVSLLYQNAIAGGISFVLYPVVAGKFKGSEPIKQLLYLASISLLFVNFEFFPIVLAGLLYGSKAGVKTSLITFFTAFLISSLLPIQSIGHFAMDFNAAIIPNPKPPVSSVTLSALIPENINIDSFNQFINDFIWGVAGSQLIIGLLIGWILIGAIPAYVKENLGNRSHLLTVAALLISSYVPFLAVNFVYHDLPGFAPTAANVLSLVLMVLVAWLLSEIIKGEAESSPSPLPTQPIQQTTVFQHQLQPPPSQPQAERAEKGGSRIEALRRELERREER